MSKIVYKFKKVMERLPYMHPFTCVLFFDMAWWCLQRGIPFRATESRTTKEEDAQIVRADGGKGRLSESHEQGRAFDISYYGWSESVINEFIIHFNKKYGHFGAISGSSGGRTLIVRHNGTNWHLHVQLDKTFISRVNLEEILYEHEN